MIKMFYHVSLEERATELKWLHEQKVYPACQEIMDWKTGKSVVGIGMIVNPETALAIKLRHKLDLQTEYRQR